MKDHAETEILSPSDGLRAAAERLVFRLGVRAHLNGYAYLTDAVALYGEESADIDIYGAVGKAYGLNRKTIMREINYALAQAFDIDKHLSALIGITIEKHEIHGSLVIAYLGKLCKRPWLSPLYENKNAPEIERIK